MQSRWNKMWPDNGTQDPASQKYGVWNMPEGNKNQFRHLAVRAWLHPQGVEWWFNGYFNGDIWKLGPQKNVENDWVDLGSLFSDTPN